MLWNYFPDKRSFKPKCCVVDPSDGIKRVLMFIQPNICRAAENP